MGIRKSFFLIICGLVVIASSGCSTKTVVTDESAEPVSIQQIKPGQNVEIHLNKEVFIEDREVSLAGMLVTDVNAERIQGDYVYNVNDNNWVVAEVEVKAEDIDFVLLMKTERKVDWDEGVLWEKVLSPLAEWGGALLAVWFLVTFL